MRRTKYAILLLILSLALTGCGVFTPSDQDLQSSLPTLTLAAGQYQYQIPTGGYSWSVYDRFGGGTSMVADTAHPLDAVDGLTSVSLTGGTDVSLQFSLLPDSVSVVFWRAGESDYENSAPLDSWLLDGAFHFTAPEETEDLVFQVTAQWTSYDDVGGTVSYPFTTVVHEG